MNTENDTLSKIKLAALALFNQKGYTATTTREIANEVGIKSSTLYFYFKSKEEIFYTLYKEAMKLFEDKLLALLDEGKDKNVEKQLYICFRVLMEFFIENNLYYRFIYRYLIRPVYSVQGKIQMEQEQWLNIATRNIYRLFYTGKEEGLFRNLSVDNLAKSFFRIQNGYIYELILNDKIPSKEEIDEVWETYWDGIKA